LKGLAPSRVLLATDFDGTLAPIVEDPGAARADLGISRLLSELLPALAAVAVISGRDVTQLRALLPIAGLRLVGNHGLEWGDGNGLVVADGVEHFLPAIQGAKVALAGSPAAAIPGVRVEDKRTTLSLHYRQTADPLSTGQALEAALRPLAQEFGLRLHPGRMVWELRPPVPVDKGDALRRLVQVVRPQGVIYLGDDAADREAFAVAHEFPGPHLAVGVASHEVPDSVFALCDIRLDGIPAVHGFLQTLLSWTRR